MPLRSAPITELLPWSLRTLADRVIPAALFAFAATSRFVSLYHDVGRRPETADPDVLALYQLELVHDVVAFLFLALISVLCVTRRPPRGSRAGLFPFTIALLGTFILSVLTLYPRTIDDASVLVLSNLLTVSGLIFTLYAVGSLGTCFGIAPEARGLVTGGAYRMVRHPVYLGEFIAGLGLFLPVIGPMTSVAFVAFCVLQAWRMRLEERVLERTFEGYAAYRRQTPALLPWPRPAR